MGATRNCHLPGMDPLFSAAFVLLGLYLLHKWLTSAQSKVARWAAGVYLLSAVIANSNIEAGLVSDAAKWTYLTPLMLGLYAPVLLPSLVLPEEYMSSYSRALAGLGGLQITESLSVDDLNDWFPEEYRRGEHLPPHFRGIYWMDGNGGCEGSGCSDIASLGKGAWDPKTRILNFPLYAPYTFSHHPSCYADILRAVSWHWTYVFHFDEALEEAEITLRVLGVDLPTGSMGSFRIKAIGPDGDRGKVWERPSWLGKTEGEPNHMYYLRRLVDQEGVMHNETISMFKKAYDCRGEVSEAEHGFGATDGICTHPNQVIRTG